eukprot:PhF_6_TR42772/c1_g3_i1/m.64698
MSTQVTLLGFGRYAYGPDPSPFVLKAETFLRLTKIEYKYKTGGLTTNKSGRLPGMAVTNGNGEKTHIEDSQRMIEYLKKEFKLTIDAPLTEEDVLVGKALLEVLQSSLYHCIVRSRWVDNIAAVIEAYPMGLPMIVKNFVIRKLGRKQVISSLNTHGNGDLTNEEYLAVMLNDVKYVELLLKQSAAKGGKFILASSGAQPSSYDACTYAMVSSTINGPPAACNTIAAQYVRSSAILQGYLQRVETLAFPDMNEIKEVGKKRIASERAKDKMGVVIVSVVSAGLVVGLSFAIRWGLQRFL